MLSLSLKRDEVPADGHRRGQKENEMKKEGALFSKEKSKHDDPVAIFLDSILAGFSKDEQFGKIKEILKQEAIWNNNDQKKVEILLDALKKLFENADYIIRQHLVDIYNSIPEAIEGDRQYDEKIEAAPELKIAILKEIIRGWRWSRGSREQDELGADAETCFTFLCDSFKKAPESNRWGNYSNCFTEKEKGKIRKGIIEMFREYLDVKGYYWKPNELDHWILLKSVPIEITEVLLKARVRIAELHFSISEIEFLDIFDFHNRSEKEIQLIEEHMKKVRLTGELTNRLKKIVSPASKFGEPTRDERFNFSGDVKYSLLSENKAKLLVNFRRINEFHLKQEQLKYPAIIKDIQIERDKILKKVEDPPIIMIEAVGPEFSFKEDK